MHKYKIKFIFSFLVFLLGLVFALNIKTGATTAADWELNPDGYYYYIGTFPENGDYHLIILPSEHQSQELEYKHFESGEWRKAPPIDGATGKGYNAIKVSFFDGGNFMVLRFAHAITEAILTTSNSHIARKQLRYQSPDTLSPVINGETNYITNVDNPVSEATIRSGLSAFDNVDGYLDSSHFVLVSDGYTANNDTLGTYIIKYKVSDSSGNTAQVNVNVTVADVTKPTITGTNTYQVVYNQTLSLDTIISNLTVTDNYDTGLTPVLVSNNYTSNKSTKGAWVIAYKATDTSGNESNLFNVTVNVIDNIKPVISGTNAYSTGTKQKLSETNIRNAITAVDEYDGNLPLQLVSDNYTENYNQLGDHTITYKATDSSNNTMEFVVTVTVTDDIAPEVFTNRYFINIDGALNYTLEQIIEHLIATGQITAEALANYDIEASNYSSAPGEYEIRLTKKASAPSDLAESIVIKVKVFEESQIIDPTPEQLDGEPKNMTLVIVIIIIAVGLTAISILLGIRMKRRKKY